MNDNRLLRILLFACLLLVPAGSGLRADPPHEVSTRQKLTRSLRTAAVPVCSAWRKNLAAHVQAEELSDNPSHWMRTPQGFLQDVQRVTVERIQDKATPYRGIVIVGVEWKTPLQLYFNSEATALSAELTESDPGQLYLLFVYRQGHWQYLRGTEKPPTLDNWKPRPPEKTPEGPHIEP